MKKFDFIKNILSFRTQLSATTNALSFGICIKNIKRMVISTSSITALLSAFAFISCNIGLGEEVDVKAPALTITSHKDNDTVPTEFTLSGLAYDNDGVKAITIDFEDADLHYQITPGSAWQKKTSANSDWTYVSDGEGSCVSTGSNSWKWSIYVDTNEKSSSKTDSNFSLEAVATDAMGNSSSSSKVEISLVVDENNPNVTMNVPTTILTGDYDAVKSEAETYTLKNGDVISKLLNGDLTFSGRQENSLSFKQLRIEFDNGKLSSGTVKVTGDAELSSVTTDEIAANVSLGDEETPTVYFSKTLSTGEDGISDLRSWEFTVNASEWASDEKNPELKSGMHLIRVISTSVSDSLAWQRKIIGYFVWWPEADTPWITTYTGSESDAGSVSEIYPSSSISGNAYDDDGIQSITYSVQKKNNGGTYADGTESSIKIPDEGAKYTAWTVTSPSENGNYKITLKITDIYGTSDSVVRYFKVMDVQPPSITISSPENGSPALSSSDANLTFSGEVSDDGTVDSLQMVYLNPALSGSTENRIKYLNGSESDWENASEQGFTDADGNIVYLLSLTYTGFDSEAKINKYTFSKNLNLFDDLKIDGSTKLLEGQDFIFRTIDNGGSTKVESISLTGDTETPVLTLGTLTLYDASGAQVGDVLDFEKDETPTISLIRNGYYAVVTGKWSDNSTTLWGGSSKIGEISLSFGNADCAVTKSSDGTWSATLTNLPLTSSSLSASLKDYGGNEKKTSKSVFIEAAEASLSSVTSDDDDGSYKAGKTISINLEFSKNVTFEGTTPSLSLNTGATALYTSGNGTAKHVFTYTVGENDKNVQKLGVTSINQTGTTWKDKSVGSEFAVSLPADSTKTLEGTRSIAIDTVSPAIKSVSIVSAPGHYNAGKQISLMMEFNENVSIEKVDSLKLVFTHKNNETDVTTTNSSGTSVVIFSYDVASGDNSSALALSSISHDSVKITDNAGNELSDWTALSDGTLISSISFSGIVIDTTLPEAPSINASFTNGDIILDSSGTSFAVTGEDGATIEYTTDGSTWSTYKGAVSLSNNGTYTIKARQTDKAGNVSAESSTISVTVDKGELLKRISATTVSGTYSTATSTKTIEGYIEFRKAVTIEKGSAVTLNVASSNGNSVALTECKSNAASGTKFTFSYAISDGDYIENGDKLDVTAFSFSSVTCSGSSVSMSVPEEGEGRRLNENREIYIYTGAPSVSSVSILGEGSEAVLTVTFDREITKVSGNIVFKQDVSTYRIPAVLSVSEYGNIPSSAQSYYSKGMNGATLNSDNTLTNDTTTKYVLAYDKDITDKDLVKVFTDANMHVVSVPIVASAVSTSGKVLTVNLGSTYKLPTKGANYTLEIPAGAVTDKAQNRNTECTRQVTAKGVEAPEIRINKENQEISISNASAPTTTATVTMPATAGMKISCRTPGATIYYAKTEDSAAASSACTINTDSIVSVTTDNPTVTSLSYSSSSDVTITSSLGTDISGYDSATGMKYAIATYATKNNYESDKAYEYATRTVLKLNISSYGNGNEQCSYEGSSGIIEGSELTYGQLRVWIQGGDSTSGGNSLEPFPLSWGTCTNFKLMTGNHLENSMKGNYYWVTWNLNAKAYHGFVLGNVHDYGDNGIGPSVWYATDCGWTKYKSSYPLNPGETLIMVTSLYGGNTFQFNSKLKCTN